jgi:ribonuclease Z
MTSIALKGFFLGTSASLPSTERNHPGLLVEAGSHRIMVDCGEGTRRQLLRSGAGFGRLDRILLTRSHFDHLLGTPSLFSTLRLRQSADVMTIHASPGTGLDRTEHVSVAPAVSCRETVTWRR